MADINELIKVILLLSSATQNSDFSSVYPLLRRLRILISKLRHTTEKISKTILEQCREQELDLRLKLIIQEAARQMSESLNQSGDASEDDSDYGTRLSNAAAEALQQFFLEQELEDERLAQAQMGGLDDFQPREDWQLSQFWYDNKTAGILAREALAIAGEHGRIACVSSPTVYRQIVGLKPSTVEVKCLEYDEKFKMFGDNFIFYDFNKPLNLDSSLKHHFDVVIADPPFLSEECLTQTAMTIKYLTKDKIILCTVLWPELLEVMPNAQRDLRCDMGFTYCKIIA